MDYIDVPIVTEPDDLAALAFDYLQARIPGWQPNDANLETILTEAVSFLASALAFQASGEPTSIFRWYGPLAGIRPIDASLATVSSTWTVRDDAGYTIPAGTQVGIRAAGDVLVPFLVQTAVEIPSGETTTDAGAVTLIAVTAGAAASGLGTIGGTVELIDPLDYVTGITQTAVTTGGVDAEADADYLGRVRAELQLQSPRPIRPADFAALARNIAGIARAVAIDGYNPDDDSSDNPRMVTVAAIDVDGNGVDSSLKSQLASYLEGLREANFVVNVIDPTVTDIDVTFTVAVADGFDQDAVVANAEAAVSAWLDPASWGIPATGDSSDWVDGNTVRYDDIVYVIRRTPGVAYIVSIALNEHTAVGTFTVTVASPAVFTLTSHGLSVGDQVILQTTGALPTGLEPNTVYYVSSVADADTFELSATSGGSAIDTTGTQTGTHSLYRTGTSDVTLDGPASLPSPNTITGSHS